MELSKPLKELRLSIIGDDDEKQLVVSSDINVLMSMLEQREEVKQLLIIFYSLTLNSQVMHRLLGLDIVNKLLLLAAGDHEQLVLVCKVLNNISSNDITIDLSTQQGLLFVQLLYNTLTLDDYTAAPTTDTLLAVFHLIPHLPQTELKKLVSPLLQSLDKLITAPRKELMDRYSTTLFPQCYDALLSPCSVKTSILVGPLLFALTHLLYQDDDDEEEGLFIDGLLSKETYFVLTSFLKSMDPTLKLGAISLLVHYSLNSQLVQSQKNNNVKKLLPHLIEQISVDQSVSRKFNPYYILSKLCLSFEVVNEYLLDCNIIVQFTDLIQSYIERELVELDEAELNKLSDVFLILSSVTVKSEQNRKMILEDDLVTMIQKILRFHVSSLESSSPLLSVSNTLAVSTCYLLRSLSRSVANLRTYLSELAIIPQLYSILRFDELTLDKPQGELLLKTIVLSICANLVLDFSPLRKVMLQSELLDILGDSLLHAEHLPILVNSLYVIRHVLYNEKDEKVREQVMEVMGFENLIQLCNHADLSVQEQALNVLRNLTCHKREIVYLLDTMCDSPGDGAGFFRFIYMKLTELTQLWPCDTYHTMVECVVFIIVNICALDETRRDLIMSRRELLRMVYDILNNTKDDQVRMACVWCVINLGWLETVQQRSGEGVQFGEPRSNVRCATLRQMGFIPLLQRVIEECEDLEVRERSKVALGNLERRDL